MSDITQRAVAIVGAGPSGLFAAEALLARGFAVALYDRMPSPGRKFLLAGASGGLNLTNALAGDEFAARYGANGDRFAGFLSGFSPEDLIAWLSTFGVSTRRGSGGKVFPDVVDAPTLLARWMERLYASPSFSFHPGYRLVRIASPRALSFETEDGLVVVNPDAAILALGGASWPATGSDGSWRGILASLGIDVAPFRPANCGFEADWPETLKARFAHVPLKNVRVFLARGDGSEVSARGELTLTPYGLEGGPIYALGSAIRDGIERSGRCEIGIDLAPDLSREAVVARLAGGPGKQSVSNFLRKRLGLSPVAVALLRHGLAFVSANGVRDPSKGFHDPSNGLRDPAVSSALVKALPLALYRPRPIEEAISTAGGVSFSELDDSLMLRRFPGLFLAGEMLDWEAPTGGFLLQGCFSTGYRAALGVEALFRDGRLA